MLFLMTADMLNKLKPILGDQADDIWQYYLGSNERSRTTIQRYVQILLDQYVDGYEQENIILKPPAIEDIKGNFVLGMILYPDVPYYPFLFEERELNSHVLLCGRTGVGKTTLIYSLISQILVNATSPILIFDFKRDYRHMLTRYDNIHVIRWHDFRINPLTPPPGMDRLQWLLVFCDVFCQVSSVLLGSKGFLLEQLTGLHKENPMPTIAALSEKLDREYISPVRRQAVYLDVIRNRLKTVMISLGEVLNCQGFDVQKMLKSNVVLELDGLSTEMQDFLVNILLMQIFCYRISQNQRGKLRHTPLVST